MSTPVTITTIGRVTADLELKTSQNGKNTKYIQFGFAVNKGYGDDTHANFYSCVLYGEAAQRMMDAKVKKGSLIQIVGHICNDGSKIFIRIGRLLLTCFCVYTDDIQNICTPPDIVNRISKHFYMMRIFKKKF